MFRMPPISQNPYLIVALGGALGSMMRYGAAVLFGASPLTTFLVNVTGSFCIGALAASTGSTTIRLLLGTGVLGGFTTFSAWQLEAVLSVRLRGFTQAPLWILFGSLGAGFASCWLGHLVGDRLRFG
jgi:CrcB protein